LISISTAELISHRRTKCFALSSDYTVKNCKKYVAILYKICTINIPHPVKDLGIIIGKYQGKLWTAIFTPAAESHGLWPWMNAPTFDRDVAPLGR
jgi:hypothetical protein